MPFSVIILELQLNLTKLMLNISATNNRHRRLK